jgi:hypothetical protein
MCSTRLCCNRIPRYQTTSINHYIAVSRKRRYKFISTFPTCFVVPLIYLAASGRPGHPFWPGFPLHTFAHRGLVMSTMPLALIHRAYSGKTFPVAWLLPGYMLHHLAGLDAAGFANVAAHMFILNSLAGFPVTMASHVARLAPYLVKGNGPQF